MIKRQRIIITILYIIILIIMATIINIKIHPTYIIFILIIFRLSVCLRISWSIINPILSIILFIIIIRGVLILFLYFSRLISNEQTKIKFNWLLLIFISRVIIIVTTIINNDPRIIHNEEKQSINLINEYPLSNIKIIYEYPYANLSIKCIVYLLISIFTIIKICSFKNSALRKINN